MDPHIVLPRTHLTALLGYLINTSNNTPPHPIKLFIFSSKLLYPHIFLPQWMANPSHQFSGPKPWSHPWFFFCLSYPSSANLVVSTFRYIQNLSTAFQFFLPPYLEPPISLTWIIVDTFDTCAPSLQLTPQSE